MVMSDDVVDAKSAFDALSNKQNLEDVTISGLEIIEPIPSTMKIHQRLHDTNVIMYQAVYVFSLL